VGLDRAIIERVRDPLVHLVRNAIDHGIELPEKRVAAGKPPGGTVRVSAAMHGASMEVVVADDGAGIDRDLLRRRAEARGLRVPEENDVATLVFAPGVSTATAVTELSGRGVGLDAVRAAVEGMRGNVTVTSAPGNGTRFRLALPLTLTTLRVVLFLVGEQIYALNSTWLERFMRLDPAQVMRSGGRPALRIDGRSVPLIRLADVLGERLNSSEMPRSVLLLDARGVRLALAVDELLEERDIVLRSLGPRLNGHRLVAGVTLLEDGTIALALRGSVVAEEALALASRPSNAAGSDAAGQLTKRILLVDDSVTTRALERSILEAAGYDVITAGDGAAAWKLLERETVDVVVSDVDMPEMNGFALVEAIRGSSRLRDLPIILVTGRENEADRAHGLEAGADAYMTKAGFRQEALIEAIGELV
jgi:two-component system chemotaxis sensor kinase CheA